MRRGGYFTAHASGQLRADFRIEQKAEIESRRLFFDNERETRHHELEQKRVEVETRRAKTAEDREARLQRKEEREGRIEELRIEAQKAQTTMLIKLVEMLQRKERLFIYMFSFLKKGN
jgi:hypothetical protein